VTAFKAQPSPKTVSQVFPFPMEGDFAPTDFASIDTRIPRRNDRRREYTGLRRFPLILKSKLWRQT
jgi:hypothetical protein